MEAFKIFDRDQDGYLKFNDIREIFKILGENVEDEKIEKLIKLADKDND